MCKILQRLSLERLGNGSQVLYIYTYTYTYMYNIHINIYTYLHMHQINTGSQVH